MRNFFPRADTKIVAALVAVVLLCCAAFARAKRPYTEQPIEISDYKSSVKGTLLLPSGAQDLKMAVALIVAGSGPTDRNGNSPLAPVNNSLRSLAVALGEHGIASVRFDKRGIGESTKIAEEDLRLETYVNDTVAFLRVLKADHRFDKVVLIGHSEGALIGLLAAQKVEVSGVACIEGTALKASALLRRQLRDALPSDLREANEAILDSLEAGRQYAFIPAALQVIYRPSVQPYLMSWFRYLPTEEIKKVDSPILIVQGENDAQLEPGAGEELLRARPDAQLVLVNGMDHSLRIEPAASLVDGLKSGPETVAGAVFDMIQATR